MDKPIDSQSRHDYTRARFKAFWRGILAALSGEPNNLLSYDEVKEKLHIGGPIYRGVKTVRVDQIIGSLNRYQDFDRAFLPLQDKTADRWQRVNQAFYNEVSLPPVVLYQVGEVYFVVDGHHRVSVAREQNQIYIDAEVRECATRVAITPDIRPEDLEDLHDKVHFIERTEIDRIRPEADITVTLSGGYDRMLEHIAVHRYFMGLDEQRDITEEEAVAHWYDQVYLPIVRVVRESGILQDFPGRTEADLYLWVLDHQHYLYQQGKDLQAPAAAAWEFLQSKEEDAKDE